MCTQLNIKCLKIAQLSDTRWACRYSSVKAVVESHDGLMAALDKISKSRDTSKFEAQGLILQLQSF